MSEMKMRMMNLRSQSALRIRQAIQIIVTLTLPLRTTVSTIKGVEEGAPMEDLPWIAAKISNQQASIWNLNAKIRRVWAIAYLTMAQRLSVKASVAKKDQLFLDRLRAESRMICTHRMSGILLKISAQWLRAHERKRRKIWAHLMNMSNEEVSWRATKTWTQRVTIMIECWARW